MKLLHLSDLHLGKRVFELSMLEKIGVYQTDEVFLAEERSEEE